MAKYKNKTVKLNKPMRGDVKKFKVFVKDRSSGKVKKVGRKCYLNDLIFILMEKL